MSKQPKNRNVRLRLLSNIVIAYMLIAFSWWSVLLFTKNRDAFQAKKDRMAMILIAKGAISNETEIEHILDYQELKKKYKRQEYMIFGEAGVFIVTLIIGVFLINRGNQKAIEAAEQRRNFLLSITHELKSPIASIRLVLETFIKRKLKQEQQEKLLSNALKETERLHNLVNDLLLSAKLEATYQPHFEPLNIIDLLQDLIAKLTTKYPRAKFDLQKNDEIPIIFGDKMGLTSVALNLLENAVKYGGENPEVKAHLHQQNGNIFLTVSDNGIGIPDKEKKNIFEKFYRVGSEETRTTKGTGLGLYIVNEIVKAHKGNISVENNHPTGSVFQIELPITTQS